MSSSILSIGSNISSLRAQRQLGTATSSLTSSFEKLSSGLRINKASDDAAGLAVASSLKADTRIYSQGVRNLNDGVSALNIADGALSNLSAIVIRMQELAEQAANGAVGWKQRNSLDAEAQALAKEYFRISRTTDFNGQKLLDGSIQGLSLQAGYGSNGSILSSLGGALGTGVFGASVAYMTEVGPALTQSTAITTADLNGDGRLDLVTAGVVSGNGRATILMGNGDGTFSSRVFYQAESGGSNAITVSDVNGDGVFDLVTAGGGAGGRATIRLGNGDGTFRSSISYQTDGGSSYALSMSDVNGDGTLDLVTAGTDAAYIVGCATIRLGNGNGTFRSSLSYLTDTNATYALSLCDLDGDGSLDLVAGGGANRASIRLGNGDGTFRSSVSYQCASPRGLSTIDVNGDSLLDLVAAGLDSITVFAGNGNGTFRSPLTYQIIGTNYTALSACDINGDGILDLAAAGQRTGGFVDIRLGTGNGTFSALLSYQMDPARSNGLSLSDLNNDGVLDLATVGWVGFNMGGSATVRLAVTRDGISPLLPFSLKTQADALQAIPVFKQTLDRLSMQRGQIGAFQSRLSCALNTLGSTVLEYKGAQSRVEDIDVAGESANLVRQQILQQAASSVLAQANQGPALALSLLRG